MNTAPIKDFTLWARERLTREARELLLQIYGIESDGTRRKVPALERSEKARAIRAQIDKLFADEKDAGLTPAEAFEKLVKEVAFTHLNRLVALKLLEARKLIRGAIDKHHASNGFLMYLGDDEHEEERKLYEQGNTPKDELDESPRDRAYRCFLLWQCGELAREVKVLFDPDSLPSKLFPRPAALREVIDRINSEELEQAWRPGNEETIGWVYQFFNAGEKDAAFDRVFKQKKKFEKTDIPAVTQTFTPRWIVKFLVHNSLGWLWLSTHPDSRLGDRMEYLVPLAGDPPAPVFKSVREIRCLDPACGTMHFGLIAFDLLTDMYREEMEHTGRPGWPDEPPVSSEEEIPGAVIANNLFGIDIDLRAVQLSALTLYLRAKTFDKRSVLQESNLACADVALFRGVHLREVLDGIRLPVSISKPLLRDFFESLNEAGTMGSLVRLERHFEKSPGPELRRAIDDFVRKQRERGVDESYFAGEASKGLRLLDVLSRKYDIVFTNPPYMSSRNMNAAMSAFLKRDYKKSKGDLYAAFIQRCAELLANGGRLGMITQQSFLFISTYEDLRKILLSNTAVETMAHVGPRAFCEVQGEKVNTTVFVLRREHFEETRRDSVGVYFRLVKEPDAEAKRRAFEEALERRKRGEAEPRVFEYRQGDFAAIPGSPWVYWITPSLRRLFHCLSPLRSIAEPKIGMRTGDNRRFLRFWWEVGQERIAFGCEDRRSAAATGRSWFPYMKGGEFRRWYGNQEHVVIWKDDGTEIKENTRHEYPQLGENLGWKISNESYYFRRGVTWTDLTAGRFSARLSPGGFIFDVSGSSVFPPDVDLVLGVMNSSFAQYALKLINPTVHVQVGDLARLPTPERSSGLLRDLVEKAVALAKADSEDDETTYDFIAPPDWKTGIDDVAARRRELARIEEGIDEEVYRLYGISEEDRKAIEEELAEPVVEEEGDGGKQAEAAEAPPITREELAARWVSYGVGIALGRFQPGIEGALGRGRFAPELAARLRDLADADGIMVLEEGHPEDLAARVIRILETIYGDREAAPIVQAAAGKGGPVRAALERYLGGKFFQDHLKLYRKRPVYWLIQSPKKRYSLYLFHEKATADTLALIRSTRYLGGRINRLERELEQIQAELNPQQPVDKLRGNFRGTSAESAAARADTSRQDGGRLRRRAGELLDELEDLKVFDRRLEAASRYEVPPEDGGPRTVGWEPEFDDGVLINAAPLHELLPSWRALKLEAVWRDLAAGKYDWSKTAMRYWPKRALEACRKNKSYAIAHGLA